MQTRAMSAFWPAMFSTEMVTPRMAMRNSQTHIATAPQISKERRPKRSTAQIPGTVMPMLTILMATEMRKGFLKPALVKNVMPSVEVSGRFDEPKTDCSMAVSGERAHSKR